jgi:addiction module HigA family antidote
MGEKIMDPIYPGEVLVELFMEPLGITRYKLAKDLNVPAPRIYDIVDGKRAISADTALRLARYFDTSPEFWLNLQSHYDLEVEEDRGKGRIEREVQPLAASLG